MKSVDNKLLSVIMLLCLFYVIIHTWQTLYHYFLFLCLILKYKLNISVLILILHF